MFAAYALIFTKTFTRCKYDCTGVEFYLKNSLNIKTYTLNRWLIFGILIKNKADNIFGISTFNYKKNYKVGFGRLTWYWIFRILSQKKLFLLSKEYSNIHIKNRFLEYETALKKYELAYSFLQKNINKAVSFSKKKLNDFNYFYKKTIKNYTKKINDYVGFTLKTANVEVSEEFFKIKKKIRKIKFADKKSIRKRKRLSKKAEIFFLKKKKKNYTAVDLDSKFKKCDVLDNFLANTSFSLNIIKKKVQKTLWDLKMAKVLYFGKLSFSSTRINNLKNVVKRKILTQKKNYIKNSKNKNKYLIFQYLFPKNQIELEKSNEFIPVHDDFKNKLNSPINTKCKRYDAFVKENFNNNLGNFLKSYKPTHIKNKNNQNLVKKNTKPSLLKNKKLLIRYINSEKKNKININNEIAVLRSTVNKKRYNSLGKYSKYFFKKNINYLFFSKKFKNNSLGGNIYYKNNKNTNKINLSFLRFSLNILKYDHLVFNILTNTLSYKYLDFITTSILNTTVSKYKIFGLDLTTNSFFKKFKFSSKLSNGHSFFLEYRKMLKAGHKLQVLLDNLKFGWNRPVIKKNIKKNKKYFKLKLKKVKERHKKLRLRLKAKKLKAKKLLKKLALRSRINNKFGLKYRRKKLKFYSRNEKILIFAKTLKPFVGRLPKYVYRDVNSKNNSFKNWRLLYIFGKKYKRFWWKRRPNNFYKRRKINKKLKAGYLSGKYSNFGPFLNKYYHAYKNLKLQKYSISTSRRFLFLKKVVNYNFKKFLFIKFWKCKNNKIDSLSRKYIINGKVKYNFLKLKKKYIISKLKIKKIKCLNSKKKALKYAISRKLFNKINHVKRLKKIRRKKKKFLKRRMFNLVFFKIKTPFIFQFKKKKIKKIKRKYFWHRFKKGKKAFSKIKKLKKKSIKRQKRSIELYRQNTYAKKKKKLLLKKFKNMGGVLKKNNIIKSKIFSNYLISKNLIKFRKSLLFNNILKKDNKLYFGDVNSRFVKITENDITCLLTLKKNIRINVNNKFFFFFNNNNLKNSLIQSVLSKKKYKKKFIEKSYSSCNDIFNISHLLKIKRFGLRFKNKKKLNIYKKKNKLRLKKKYRKIRRGRFRIKKIKKFKYKFKKIIKFIKYWDIFINNNNLLSLNTLPKVLIRYKKFKLKIVCDFSKKINRLAKKNSKLSNYYKKFGRAGILLKKINKKNKNISNLILNNNANVVFFNFYKYTYKFNNKSLLGMKYFIERKLKILKKNREANKNKKIKNKKKIMKIKNKKSNNKKKITKIKKKKNNNKKKFMKIKNKKTSNKKKFMKTKNKKIKPKNKQYNKHRLGLKKNYKNYKIIHKLSKSKILNYKFSPLYINSRTVNTNFYFKNNLLIGLGRYLHFFWKKKNYVKFINIYTTNNFYINKFKREFSNLLKINKKSNLSFKKSNNIFKNIYNKNKYYSYFKNNLIAGGAYNCRTPLKNKLICNLKQCDSKILNNYLLNIPKILFKQKFKIFNNLLSFTLKKNTNVSSNFSVKIKKFKKYLNLIRIGFLKKNKKMKKLIKKKRKKKLILFKNPKIKNIFLAKLAYNSRLRIGKRTIKSRRFSGMVKKNKRILMPFLFFSKNKKKINKKINKSFYRRFCRLKEKFILFDSHMLPYRIENEFYTKNLFLSTFKNFKINKLNIKDRVLTLSKHYKLVFSTNLKTKNKKIKQTKHNFFNRKKNKSILKKFKRLKNIRRFLKKRIKKYMNYRISRFKVRKFKLRLPRPRKFWIGSYAKAKKIDFSIKKKIYKNYINSVKFKDFGFKKIKFRGAKYTKFAVKLKRIKNIKASTQAKASRETFLILKYWRKLKKHVMFLTKKKKRSFFFKNEPKWVFFKRKFYNWKFNFRYAKPRHLQFSKRFLPKYWYKVIRRKFPLKRKKKEWSVKIPKVYTLLYFKKNKRLTFFDSSAVYFRYLSSSSVMKRYKKLNYFTNKIYTQDDENWLYECEIYPTFSRFAGLRSIRKRSKGAKSSFSTILLKKRFSKLFYPSVVFNAGRNLSKSKKLQGYKKTLNILGGISSVFFKNKYKTIKLFFAKLKKNLSINSDFDSISFSKIIEQGVEKKLLSDSTILTNSTFNSKYNKNSNSIPILGHIYIANKEKLINNIIKTEYNTYSIVNYRYDNIFNLELSGIKSYKNTKTYNFKIKQLIHSKYNEFGSIFQKNLYVNGGNIRIYSKLFNLSKKKEITVYCKLHQFTFLTNFRNKTIRYKQITPIFLNKISTYFKKNIHIFRAVSITKGKYINSVNTYSFSG